MYRLLLKKSRTVHASQYWHSVMSVCTTWCQSKFVATQNCWMLSFPVPQLAVDHQWWKKRQIQNVSVATQKSRFESAFSVHKISSVKMCCYTKQAGRYRSLHSNHTMSSWPVMKVRKVQIVQSITKALLVSLSVSEFLQQVSTETTTYPTVIVQVLCRCQEQVSALVQ